MSDDGLVLCLDARRGKVIWSRNLVEDYHVLRPRYGFSASPVVEGDCLLITCNSYGIAIDKSTDDALWRSPAEDANGAGFSLIDAYATSVVFNHGQSRSMFQFDDYGVYEVEIATGTPLWFFPWPNVSNNERWANVADPLVFADRLFISTSNAICCALLDIGSGKPRVI